QLLNVGKNVVGATNSLHYAMLSQDSMLKPLDDAVAKAASTFYDNVYVRGFALDRRPGHHQPTRYVGAGRHVAGGVGVGARPGVQPDGHVAAAEDIADPGR